MSFGPGVRTTTAKLLLFYALTFSVITLAAMTLVETQWTQLSMREIRSALSEQSTGLAGVFRDEGLDGLRDDIQQRERANFDPEAVYALWSADGALLAGNISPRLEFPSSGMREVELTLASSERSRGRAHAVIAQIVRLPDRSVLLVGRDVQSRLDLQNETFWLVRWTLAIIAALGVAGALHGGRRVLHQIDRIAQTTRRIADGELTHRLPVAGSGDEFDRLAIAINAMLEHIEYVNAGMQTVIDAVAHDLRRPLTHARQALETALDAGDGTSAGPLIAAQDALDSIQRTLDALLHIVQADAGISSSQKQASAIDAIVRDVVELYEPLAQSSGVRLLLDTEAVVANVHHQLLAQALANLIDNAIKYAPASGDVRIVVRADHDALRLTVSDHGPGIPVDMRQRVLGRFVRLVDDSAMPGSGLGLSLVAAVVRLHRGKLTLTDAAPGLIATIELPLAP